MSLLARIYESSFVRFLVGGGVTYATALLAMGLWHGLLSIPNLPAYALTLVTVLIVGFFLNRGWIFRAGDGPMARQGVRFLFANAGFRVVDWCVYSAITLLLEPPVALTIFLANVIVLPLKYLFYRRRVFGNLAESPT